MINKFKALPDNILKSMSDQIKLLSWAFGAINSYFIHTLGKFSGVVLVISGWLILQAMAHYLLFFIKKD